MGELTRPTIYQILHVMDDDIQFEVYSNEFGHTKDIESLAGKYVNRIELCCGTFIFYTD